MTQQIQYPELQERFKVDMIAHHIVLKCVAWLFPRYDFAWASDYIKKILSKELGNLILFVQIQTQMKNLLCQPVPLLLSFCF
jgi:hypothetical protein